ncbi:MAG: inositol monophosphatase [Candidatus Solibacter usitatus]|nr:inositol monophosphatase [Candidatus Solibacter usitatus]
MIVALHKQGSFEVRRKPGSELVTTADLQSDELIRRELGSKFPDFRFLSEETAVEAPFDFSGAVWVIDPIDGTANYVHGHPYVSISIALLEDGKPRIGVVHAPFLRETFAAIDAGAATCNGVPIRVSEARELRRALVGTGVPHDRSDLTIPMERIRRLVAECQDVRRPGSPALDICWVAAGRLDAHCESLAPWDIAAAGLIATEAGAVRGNLRDGDGVLPPALRGEEFIVAAPGIFEELCRLLGEKAKGKRQKSKGKRN